MWQAGRTVAPSAGFRGCVMERQEQRRSPVPDAVIIVHDRLEHPLWDRRAAQLADAVERRLEEVFVMAADASSRNPSLRDALRAAGFVGSRSALVVVGDDETARRIDGVTAALPFTVVIAPTWSADVIAATVRREAAALERRVCA